MSIFVDWPWLLPAAACGIGLIMLMFRSPKVWLGLFMIALPQFLTDTGEGLSVTEAVSGGLFTFAIIIWLAKRLTVDPRPLIEGWTDFLLLFFIIAAGANVVVARFNHVELFGWAVDWSYFLLMLYCFPLREEFGASERTFRQFLAISGVSAILMALYSGYIFRQKMAENMIYAYQITASRSATLGPVFLLVICIAIVLIFHVRWRTKAFTFLVLVVNLGALVLTFTRTLWVFVFLSTFVAMLFLRWSQNVRIISTSVLLGFVAVTAFYTINPKIADVALRLVKHRFTSSTQLSGGDRSFETRLIEVNNAWRKVKQAPLGGNGLRAKFVTWAPIEQWHNATAFVHIGYVGLIHKLGFPTASILFLVLIGYTFRAFWAAWQARDRTAPPLARSVAIGVFAFMPALYVNIFMAGFFDQRYGNVMFAFIFASVAMTERFLRHARTASASHESQ